MIGSVIRALRLDAPTLRTVADRPAYTVMALTLVGGAMFVSTAGDWLGSAEGSVRGIIQQIVSGLLSWVLWAMMTFLIGRRLFGGNATLSGQLRVLGYAFAPRALWFFSGVGTVIGSAWMLAVAIAGVREGQRFRAIDSAGTVILSLIPAAFLHFMIVEIVL